MIALYAICAWIAWAPADNAISYDVYKDMIFAFNTPDTQFEACKVDYLTPITYYVVGANADEVGEPSDTLTIQWVPDFDGDDDGVVGMSDFGMFTQRWGECNDGVKVVPC